MANDRTDPSLFSFARAAKQAQYAKRWRDRYPERAKATYRRSQLKAHYGLTVDDYEELLARQGGRCAICGSLSPANEGSRTKRFAIDHDHRTGKVRGLLCVKCNVATGQCGDSAEAVAEWCLKALRYLSQSESIQKSG